MQVQDDITQDVTARLRMVEGQVAGIVRMIEQGRECRDVVRQISAASKALEQAGFKILASGLKMCSNDAGAGEAGYSEQELEKLFMQLA